MEAENCNRGVLYQSEGKTQEQNSLMGGQTVEVNLRWQTNMIIQRARLGQKGEQKKEKQQQENIHLQQNVHAFKREKNAPSER